MRIINFILCFTLLCGCAATHGPSIAKRIDGVSLEAPSQNSDEHVMKDLTEIGANYVCLMPYAFVRAGHAELIHHYDGQQWWGEREAGIRAMSIDAKSKGLSVMIKPHVWLGHGDYTGSLTFENKEQQDAWNASYKKYVLFYVQIAEELDVEMFCLGTELCSQVDENKAYWKSLIAEIRSIYSGKLTYAANWDCYSRFPFWSDLDYIGIDGYFPVAARSEYDENPESTPWDQWKPEMKLLSDSVSRPILFTEYGYRSYTGSLVEPWVTGRDKKVDYNDQIKGYVNLYDALWDEPWFAGGFFWKWHCKGHLDGDRSTDFTPQGKPVMEVIRKTYGK